MGNTQTSQWNAVKVGVVTLLLLGAYTLLPFNKSYESPSRDNDDSVTLTLLVERTVGGPPVDVSYMINEVGFSASGGLRARRWREVITVKRSDSVTLRAYQGDLVASWRDDDRLICKITSSDGYVYANDRNDVGSVRCYYNRR